MQVRWSPAAADDLEGIVNYIRKENPAAARRVAQAIYEEVIDRGQEEIEVGIGVAGWLGSVVLNGEVRSFSIRIARGWRRFGLLASSLGRLFG